MLPPAETRAGDIVIADIGIPNEVLDAVDGRLVDLLTRSSVREEMESGAYHDMSYYERWIASMETILIEKKILTRDEIDRKLAEFEKKWGEP